MESASGDENSFQGVLPANRKSMEPNTEESRTRGPLTDLSNQSLSKAGGDKTDSPPDSVADSKSSNLETGDNAISPACSTPLSSADLDSTDDYASANEEPSSPERQLNLTVLANELDKLHLGTPRLQSDPNTFSFPYSPFNPEVLVDNSPVRNSDDADENSAEDKTPIQSPEECGKNRYAEALAVVAEDPAASSSSPSIQDFKTDNASANEGPSSSERQLNLAFPANADVPNDSPIRNGKDANKISTEDVPPAQSPGESGKNDNADATVIEEDKPSSNSPPVQNFKTPLKVISSKCMRKSLNDETIDSVATQQDKTFFTISDDTFMSCSNQTMGEETFRSPTEAFEEENYCFPPVQESPNDRKRSSSYFINIENVGKPPAEGVAAEKRSKLSGTAGDFESLSISVAPTAEDEIAVESDVSVSSSLNDTAISVHSKSMEVFGDQIGKDTNKCVEIDYKNNQNGLNTSKSEFPETEMPSVAEKIKLTPDERPEDQFEPASHTSPTDSDTVSNGKITPQFATSTKESHSPKARRSLITDRCFGDDHSQKTDNEKPSEPEVVSEAAPAIDILETPTVSTNVSVTPEDVPKSAPEQQCATVEESPSAVCVASSQNVISSPTAPDERSTDETISVSEPTTPADSCKSQGAVVIPETPDIVSQLVADTQAVAEVLSVHSTGSGTELAQPEELVSESQVALKGHGTPDERVTVNTVSSLIDNLVTPVDEPKIPSESGDLSIPSNDSKIIAAPALQNDSLPLDSSTVHEQQSGKKDESTLSEASDETTPPPKDPAVGSGCESKLPPESNAEPILDVASSSNSSAPAENLTTPDGAYPKLTINASGGSPVSSEGPNPAVQNESLQLLAGSPSNPSDDVCDKTIPLRVDPALTLGSESKIKSESNADTTDVSTVSNASVSPESLAVSDDVLPNSTINESGVSPLSLSDSKINVEPASQLLDSRKILVQQDGNQGKSTPTDDACDKTIHSLAEPAGTSGNDLQVPSKCYSESTPDVASISNSPASAEDLTTPDDGLPKCTSEASGVSPCNSKIITEPTLPDKSVSVEQQSESMPGQGKKATLSLADPAGTPSNESKISSESNAEPSPGVTVVSSSSVLPEIQAVSDSVLSKSTINASVGSPVSSGDTKPSLQNGSVSLDSTKVPEQQTGSLSKSTTSDDVGDKTIPSPVDPALTPGCESKIMSESNANITPDVATVSNSSASAGYLTAPCDALSKSATNASGVSSISSSDSKIIAEAALPNKSVSIDSTKVLEQQPGSVNKPTPIGDAPYQEAIPSPMDPAVTPVTESKVVPEPASSADMPADVSNTSAIVVETPDIPKTTPSPMTVFETPENGSMIVSASTSGIAKSSVSSSIVNSAASSVASVSTHKSTWAESVSSVDGTPIAQKSSENLSTDKSAEETRNTQNQLIKSGNLGKTTFTLNDFGPIEKAELRTNLEDEANESALDKFDISPKRTKVCSPVLQAAAARKSLGGGNLPTITDTPSIPKLSTSLSREQPCRRLSDILAAYSRQQSELNADASFDFTSIRAEALKIAADIDDPKDESKKLVDQHIMQSALSTENNDSEAGPNTADDDFNKEEFFVDPSSLDLDFFSQATTKKCVPSKLARQSLFRVFDPLVGKLLSPDVRPPAMAENQSSGEENPSTPAGKDSEEKLIPITPATTKKPSPDSRPGAGGHTPSLRQEISKLQELMLQQEQAHQEKADLVEELRKRIAELEAADPPETESLQKQLKAKDAELARVKKELTEQIISNRQLVQVMEEYEKTIAQLVTIKEEGKAQSEKEKEAIAAERDAAVQHLSNMEVAFNDVHQKYERAKTVIETLHSNEKELKRSYESAMAALEHQKKVYQKFKQHAADKLQEANAELEKNHREYNGEMARMQAVSKKTELRCKSLEESLEHKMKELEEMTQICDELISKVSGQGA